MSDRHLLIGSAQLRELKNSIRLMLIAFGVLAGIEAFVFVVLLAALVGYLRATT